MPLLRVNIREAPGKLPVLIYFEVVKRLHGCLLRCYIRIRIARLEKADRCVLPTGQSFECAIGVTAYQSRLATSDIDCAKIHRLAQIHSFAALPVGQVVAEFVTLFKICTDVADAALSSLCGQIDRRGVCL